MRAAIAALPDTECRQHTLCGGIDNPIDPAALWNLAQGMQPSESVTRDVYVFFCEAVSNVRHHAYPNSADRSAWLGWEATVRVDADQKLAVFTVRDQGVGIANSVRRVPWLPEGSPADLIRLAACTEDAPHDGPWRGRGLSGMVGVVQRRRGCTFDIQSSGFLVSFSADSPMGRVSKASSGVGTTVSFSVPLDSDMGGGLG